MIRHQPNLDLLNALRVQIDLFTARLTCQPDSKYAPRYTDAIADSIEVLFYQQSDKQAIQIRIQINKDILAMGTQTPPQYDDYLDALEQDAAALLDALDTIKRVGNDTRALALLKRIRYALLLTRKAIAERQSTGDLSERLQKNAVLCEMINIYLAPVTALED